MTNFDKILNETCDLRDTERMNDIKFESAIIAELETYGIDVNDIRVYTDTETREARWVYVMTEQPIEGEIYVKRNFYRDFNIDDIDFIVY